MPMDGISMCSNTLTQPSTFRQKEVALRRKWTNAVGG